jgi:hypothetical protein
MGRYTSRGEMEPTCHTSQAWPHQQARPTPCHVLAPEHFLPHVHNLDERDLSRKHRVDRMDEVVINWTNGSTSPADQPPQPSFQEYPKRHQAKAVHPTA